MSHADKQEWRNSDVEWEMRCLQMPRFAFELRSVAGTMPSTSTSMLALFRA